MTLPDHLERYLGPIERGWSWAGEPGEPPFQVVRFGRGPSLDAVTFATLGLSRYPLHSSQSGKHIRHELLLAVRDDVACDVPTVLHGLASDAVRAGRAYLRGESVDLRAPACPGSRLQSAYMTHPVQFPAGLSEYLEDAERVAIVWVVPISEGEARIVRDRGWTEFEKELDDRQPDLLDPLRQPFA